MIPLKEPYLGTWTLKEVLSEPPSSPLKPLPLACSRTPWCLVGNGGMDPYIAGFLYIRDL